MPMSLALALLVAAASLWQLGPANAQRRQSPPDHRQAGVAEPPLDRSLNEEVVRLPIAVKTVDGRTHRREFVLTVFKPDGPGPFRPSSPATDAIPASARNSAAAGCCAAISCAAASPCWSRPASATG